jgi:4-carboxymuconolactone decarboxylase
MHSSRGRPVAHLTEAAVRNHAQLFPEHVSTLKETDPELIEVFDNFAFDEVLRHGELDPKTRVMVILASTIASQALSEYRTMLGGALEVGVTPMEAKEILYQAVPYLGIAKVLDFIHATNEVLRSRGVELPLEAQSTTTPETRRARGLALQKEIFGDRIDQMYAAAPADQRHFQEFLSANCFGDYWTRSGLDTKTRELLTFSMLAALGGAEPQLKGHIQGNLHVGNDEEKLVAVVTQLLPYIGYPRALSALTCVNEVASGAGR